MQKNDNLTVLIADDNKAWLDVESRMVREVFPNANIIACDTFKEAKHVINNFNCKIDLIISDMDMKDRRVDGFFLHRESRKNSAGKESPTFVMLSTSPLMKPIRAALGANIQCFRKSDIGNRTESEALLRKVLTGLASEGLGK